MTEDESFSGSCPTCHQRSFYWKPIETAPKREEPAILLYDPEWDVGDQVHIAIWSDMRNVFIEPYELYTSFPTATHWAPLPEPPK